MREHLLKGASTKGVSHEESGPGLRLRIVSDGGGLKEEGEDIEVVETTLEEAAAMIATGEMVDAKTVVLIQCLRDRVEAATRS